MKNFSKILCVLALGSVFNSAIYSLSAATANDNSLDNADYSNNAAG